MEELGKIKVGKRGKLVEVGSSIDPNDNTGNALPPILHYLISGVVEVDRE